MKHDKVIKKLKGIGFKGPISVELTVNEFGCYYFSGSVFEITDKPVGEGGRAIEIWASNQIGSRRFYIPSDENQELVDEMNSKLTYYDKYLLDRLCTAVKEGQTKTLEIFFDIKS